MEFDWPPEIAALCTEAEEVARDAVARYGRHSDSWINGYSRGFSRELGRRGWIGMTWPVECGGAGRSALERFVVTEALISAGAPIAAHWFADRQIGPTLLAHGTEEQRRTFLPGILAGESGWCIGMSEPDAGSDLASLRTTAAKHGDEYVVNGRKIWTSFGASADYCYLICRTPPSEGTSTAPKHANISEIIVPMDAPGITVQPIRDLTTNDHFCEVVFEDVHVPVANLVGVEGGAFSQTMRQLEHERGGIDRLLSNHALYLDAKAHADTTDPRVRQEIARIETGYRLGRLLVLREVLRQAPKSFSAATKTFCTEHEQRVAQFAANTFGADITLWSTTSRAYCYHPAYTIMGGTANVLRDIIGDRMLGLPRAPR